MLKLLFKHALHDAVQHRRPGHRGARAGAGRLQRAEGLAAEVARRLDDPELRRRQVAAQNLALDRMGRGMPDPSEAAAEALLAFLRSRGRPV
jgi:hypothetical protein